MKTIKNILVIIAICSMTPSHAQFWKKLGKKAEKAAERTVERRVEKETAKSTDRALDSIIEAPKKVNTKNTTEASQIIGRWLLESITQENQLIELEPCEKYTNLTFFDNSEYTYTIYDGSTNCHNRALFKYKGNFSIKAGAVYDKVLKMKGADNTFAFEIVSITEQKLTLALGIENEVYTYVKQ